ncbi:MAG: class I SAM-dependent methyltransferase [Phycisphaerales bacterium]|nr:MAG: class I SAM-dependent methyltransferase [Phycisphaerales bacterium]
MKAKTAIYYDRIYAAVGKDYAAEAAQLKAIIAHRKRSAGNSLLDVACGTATHAVHLSDEFEITGFDIEKAMVELARECCPSGTFLVDDMRDFDLKRTFDVVICLFSSIGFMKTRADLDAAVGNMARHVKPGGVLLIEPWITSDNFTGGHSQVVAVDEPELKLARVTRSDREGDLSVLDMQYLIATPEGLEHIAERYEMGLFTEEEYLSAYKRAGLEVELDPKGLMDRGLLIGTR